MSVAKGFVKYSSLHSGIIAYCSQTQIYSREVALFFIKFSEINKCAETLSVLVVLALEYN